MYRYTVEFDGFNDCGSAYYETNGWWELVGLVKNALDEMGGGHADIYDEDDNFIEAIEI